MLPVQLLHRLVLRPLHPLAEPILAFDGAGVVLLQLRDRPGDARARRDLLGRGLHLLADPPDLFPAPLIRVVQVDHVAQEAAGGAGVAFLADEIARLGAGQVDVGEPSRGGRVGLRGASGAGAEFGVVAVEQAVEEGFARRAGPNDALPRRLDHLPAGDDLSALHPLEQGGAVAVQGLRDLAESVDQLGPLLFGLARQVVEEAADALERRGEDVEIAPPLACVVQLGRVVEPLQHHAPGDLVALVLGCCRLQLALGAAAQLRSRGVAVGRVVGQLRLARRQAEV